MANLDLLLGAGCDVGDPPEGLFDDAQVVLLGYQQVLEAGQSATVEESLQERGEGGGGLALCCFYNSRGLGKSLC